MFRIVTGVDGAPSMLEVVDRPGLLASDVAVRPLVPGDADTVRLVFDGLSPESRRTRFLAPMPTLSPSMLERLVDVDHDRHGCWVALVEGWPVGIGRYVRLTGDPTAAEVALEVVDEYQGHGLGRMLLEVVATAAADVGVRSLLWVMDPGNSAIRSLAIPLGGRFTVEYGTLEGTTPLPEVPATDACRIGRVARAARKRAADRRVAA
ncbi:GNAT family N-acetyltransferase [Blastococcus deserti]|uniref:GNAT family N-acetyltransferase n=1 Tax=Blastococcus deserti TaxID=2259033 RepID=A0ABW4XEV0_9ACTN